MLYNAELMVYLLLLPVALFIVIPLLMLPVAMMRRLFFPASRQGLVEKETAGETSEAPFHVMERRQYSRVEAQGIRAHISDGTNSCQGEVRDISQPGICLVSPSNILDKGADNLGVLVTGGEERVQMLIKPKWKRHNGAHQHIGGVVADNREGWKAFALRLECA